MDSDQNASVFENHPLTINNNKDDLESMTTIDKCSKWLDECSLSDDCSLYSESVISNATTETEESEDRGIVTRNDSVCLGDKIIAQNSEDVMTLDRIINKKPSNYENIRIHKAQNVHIGDVTQINGPVYINNFLAQINQNITIDNTVFSIVKRRTWLAQPPLDPDDIKYFTEPRKFVIICHSASEEAHTQTDNNLLVRLIQQFHIESQKWNDISYNFLVGAEGSIYEGRGWDVIGAHTFGYNTNAIGICFIGCYIKTLPAPEVLKKVQLFIKYGVQKGDIAEDYALLGHCQCRSSESPGARLFQEIQTWDHWDETISVQNPSPLMRRGVETD